MLTRHLIAIVVYLLVAFLAAALIVRIWPKSWLGRRLQRRTSLFVIMPVMMIAALYAHFDSRSRHTDPHRR